MAIQDFLEKNGLRSTVLDEPSLNLDVAEKDKLDEGVSIFERTTYRLPNDSELDEIHRNESLSSQDIISGFSYTIIGRGIKNESTTQMIIESLQMLVNKFPECNKYNDALSQYKSENNLE
jgi:hypothetical protein